MEAERLSNLPRGRQQAGIHTQAATYKVLKLNHHTTRNLCSKHQTKKKKKRKQPKISVPTDYNCVQTQGPQGRLKEHSEIVGFNDVSVFLSLKFT